MKKLMKFTYDFDTSIYNLYDLNSSFARGSLKVMYVGNNRNGSRIMKDSVERALPSLKNVPIVCHWDDEANEIGGHDVEIVADENGNTRIRNLTMPCGVVPEHAKFSFETMQDENGVEHEYLVIDDVILWKRQDVYNHIVNDLDGKVKHSMEITVRNGYVAKDGYFEVKDFEFTALCLLENCEPCFQGSELELFSLNRFKEEMNLMMDELKETFNLINSSKEVDNTHPQNLTEGGEKVLDKKMELVAKYGIDVESLDFNIEDFTEEELQKKFEEMTESTDGGEPEAKAEPETETESETDDEDKEEFSDEKEDDEKSDDEAKEDEEPSEGSDEDFALTGDRVAEIQRVLSEVKVEREWGECDRYWFVDCDFELNEVYCWDTEDWLLYGFTYSVDGDAVTINFEDKKRKKYAIVDFEGEEQSSPFADTYSKLMSAYVAETEKYQETSDKVASMNAELEELRAFKNDTEAKALKAAKDEVLSQFEDLAGVEAFEELTKDIDKYDVETLEEKCFAIRGRNTSAIKFTKNEKTPKIKVDKENVADNPYGGLMEKYGYTSTK